MHRSMPRRMLRIFFTILAVSAPASWGQGADQRAPQGTGTGLVEEVLVTAQKRTQSQQDVPASIATLRGERLDAFGSGGADVRFLSNKVPSLQIESTFGRTFPRFYIRGLGNADFDLNASQPVALVYDDVVLENPVLKGFPVFDLDRIEILRGPQGTLFGRNTPAGIVKFESVKPAHELEGYGKLAYGRFNQVTAESAFNLPLVQDRVATRISLLYQRQDDFVDNSAPGFEQQDALGRFDEFAGRLQLLWDVTPDLGLLFNVHGRYLDGTAAIFRANVIVPGTDRIAQALPGTGSGGPGFQGVQFGPFDRQQVFHDGTNFQSASNIGGLVTVDYYLADLYRGLTIKSVTSYEHVGISSRGDIDGGFGAVLAPPFGPGPILFGSETQDILDGHRQITTELLIGSDDWGLVDFQTGFFYFDEHLRAETLSFDTLFGGGLNGRSTQVQDSRSIGVFAHLSFDLGAYVTLEGGVRYSDDRRDFSAARPMPLPFGPGNIVIEEGQATAFTRADPIAWDASLTYAATDTVNLFARIARSFRAPSIQGRVLFAAVDDSTPESFQATNGVSTADTEFILSYEAGIKADLFGRRARVNLTGFYFDLDDQQVTAVGGTVNLAELVNVADSEGAGFELEIEAAPLETLLVTAGISFNHTAFNDPNLAIPTCALCTPTDPLAVPDPQDPDRLIAAPDGTLAQAGDAAIIDGNPFPQAPDWIVAWTLRYGLPMGAGGELFFFTDWNYRSRTNFFLYESLEFTDGGLVEGGLRLGYLGNHGQWEVAAFGRNVLNDESLAAAIDFNNLTGVANAPPVWGVDFTYRFP